VRVIAFHLQPGQSVPPHRNDSTVLVQVVEGTGVFRGEDGQATLRAGMAAVYSPGELHSMEPLAGPLRFHAFITPSPGR
jgi:quercetin dioxygenase-like cupin family protein